ncbi:uncharacterized protein [Pyrus communis]|uniref:uncharacterized protein n=1 Tax=Pyrus communis TaxID=23211 RepID=UPI0035C10FA1
MEYALHFKFKASNNEAEYETLLAAHPQSNGQVEAINKIIKRTLKTSLDKAKGCWPEFVPQVLWSYRTSYRTSTGETSFSLTFGIKAVVPVELEQATFRVQNYIQSENDKQLTLNLDLVEEHRNQAHLRNVAYKQRISNYYESKVKPCSFKAGDWVLKKKLLCDTVSSEVIGISCPGSYKLRSSDGKTFGHLWNADHLKYYYKSTHTVQVLSYGHSASYVMKAIWHQFNK